MLDRFAFSFTGYWRLIGACVCVADEEKISLNRSWGKQFIPISTKHSGVQFKRSTPSAILQLITLLFPITPHGTTTVLSFNGSMRFRCIIPSAGVAKHDRIPLFKYPDTSQTCVEEGRRGESLGGGCYDRVLWAWSSATHSIQRARQPKAMQAACFPQLQTRLSS